MKQIVVVIFLVVCGGIIGIFIGQNTSPLLCKSNMCEPASPQEIESFYTDTIGVTEEQKQKLLDIEKEYLQEKEIYTKKMTVANNKLADVLEEKGYQAPEIAGIIMEIHTAMGVLQNLSLQHLATLETVLSAEQSALLKKYAVQRLRQTQ